MKVEEIIEELENELRNAKGAGVEQIPIENFELFVSEMARIAKSTPSDISREAFTIENYRARREDWLSRRDLRRRQNERMPEYTINTGEQALKAMLTVNGGAAIALLAYLGSFAKSDVALPVPASMILALQLFVGGVLCAMAAFGSRFFSQAGFGSEFGPGSAKIGIHGRRVAILLGALSFLGFGIGGFTASQGLAEQAMARTVRTDSAAKMSADRHADSVEDVSRRLPKKATQRSENEQVNDP